MRESLTWTWKTPQGSSASQIYFAVILCNKLVSSRDMSDWSDVEDAHLLADAGASELYCIVKLLKCKLNKTSY